MERLAESEASLREAQATAQLGSWDLDCRSGHLRWSEETYRLLGYEPDSVTPSQSTFYAVVHPDDEARIRAEVEAALVRLTAVFPSSTVSCVPTGAARPLAGRPGLLCR